MAKKPITKKSKTLSPRAFKKLEMAIEGLKSDLRDVIRERDHAISKLSDLQEAEHKRVLTENIDHINDISHLTRQLRLERIVNSLTRMLNLGTGDEKITVDIRSEAEDLLRSLDVNNYSFRTGEGELFNRRRF